MNLKLHPGQSSSFPGKTEGFCTALESTKASVALDWLSLSRNCLFWLRTLVSASVDLLSNDSNAVLLASVAVRSESAICWKAVSIT